MDNQQRPSATSRSAHIRLLTYRAYLRIWQCVGRPPPTPMARLASLPGAACSAKQVRQRSARQHALATPARVREVVPRTPSSLCRQAVATPRSHGLSAARQHLSREVTDPRSTSSRTSSIGMARKLSSSFFLMLRNYISNKYSEKSGRDGNQNFTIFAN